MDKEVKRKLYNVKVEVDLFVLAMNTQEAITIGKNYAGAEAVEFGAAVARPVTDLEDLPRSWREELPYHASGAAISTKTCKQIVLEKVSEQYDKVDGKVVEKKGDVDAASIIEIQESVKRTPKREVQPESRPDPKPSRELDWEKTGDKKDHPPLRFLT